MGISLQGPMAGVTGRAPCGRLSVNGTINFGVFPAQADWRVMGRICDCSAD